jgi:isopenicillin N synthase-like dioxygenase
MKAEVLVRSRGGDAKGDLNESLMIGPVDVADTAYYASPAAGRHFAPNLWPERPAGLRQAYKSYYRVVDALAIDLMRLFALALGLPEKYFDSSVDRSISRLRVRNYPAPEVAPEPGQLRAGAHSDYGSLTILKTEDRPGGLQVQSKAGDWLDVPHRPGCFVVNIGDMLARWTNDRWVSTLHRVVNPPLDRVAESRRQSVVFFQNPNYDAVVACLPGCSDAANPPKYPPTTSGGHLREKFLSTQQALAYAD